MPLEMGAENLAVIGGSGILPKTTLDSLIGILDGVEFDDDEMRYILLADLIDGTPEEKKIRIRKSWKATPRFIQSFDIRNLVSFDVTGTPGGTSDWPGSSGT